MNTESAVLADRYRLTDSIGRGGMADVYAAEDTSSGRMVAVKIMRVGEQADPDRFASEMRILDRLSHPAIVRLFDSGTTDDASPYFVMQLVDGESLSARLRAEGPLADEDAEEIGARVASALAHAHDTGVIHRDIKPANILIDTDGGAYLTDFGVARLADATLVTRAGTTIGTAAYLAPEQLQDSQVGPAADVYSFGLVLLESLTGTRAFRGTGVEAAMARLSRDPVVPDDLQEPWAPLLVAMTRRDPTQRPTAAEVELIIRAELPAPEVSAEEMASRAGGSRNTDEDPTAIPQPFDGPSSGSGPWEPPSSDSAQSVAVVPPTPPPTPALGLPVAEASAHPTVPAPAPFLEDLPRRGMDAIRSRALLVGLLLGVVVVLGGFGVFRLLQPVDETDMVSGTDPVDEAARQVLAILDASERLRAADPSLQRELVSLADNIVESVNDDRWDSALLGVVAMTSTTRDAIDTLDIEPVALNGLLEALRDLTREIELLAGAEASGTDPPE